MPGGGVLRVSVPEAFGGKTVIGQLTVDQVVGAGFVTAYGCDDGIPTDASGSITRSDLNYDSAVSPFASNRLIVEADDDGDICFYTLRPAAMIVDVNAVTLRHRHHVVPQPSHRHPPATDCAAIAGGGVLRVVVPEAVGGKTVVGQLTVDRVAGRRIRHRLRLRRRPADRRAGTVTRSDLNFDAAASPVASNRLIVQADADGDVCFYTLRPAALIVDINGVSDVGIRSFPNPAPTPDLERPRTSTPAAWCACRCRRRRGGKTVIGQLTVDQVAGRRIRHRLRLRRRDADRRRRRRHALRPQLRRPRLAGRLQPADRRGRRQRRRLLLHAAAARRSSSTSTASRTRGISVVPQPAHRHAHADTSPATGPMTGRRRAGVAAVRRRSRRSTGSPRSPGLPADATVTQRPILAVKIDNYGAARPQWGLDQADAVIEVNVEGVTRFVALFHTNLPAAARPGAVGSYRRPRPADGDEPSGVRVLGRQPGRDAVDRLGRGLRSARRLQRPALRRATAARPTEPARTTCCSTRRAPHRRATTAGPARPLWHDRSGVDATASMSPPAPTRRSPCRWTASASSGRGTPRRARTCGRRTASRTSPCRARGSRPPMSSSSQRATSRRRSTPAPRTRSRSAQGSPWCTATAWPSRRRGHAPPRTTTFEFHDAATNQPISARHRHDVPRVRARLTAIVNMKHG